MVRPFLVSIIYARTTNGNEIQFRIQRREENVVEIRISFDIPIDQENEACLVICEGKEMEETVSTGLPQTLAYMGEGPMKHN